MHIQPFAILNAQAPQVHAGTIHPSIEVLLPCAKPPLHILYICSSLQGLALPQPTQKQLHLIVLDHCYLETSEKLLPTTALATDPSKDAVHKQAPATPMQSWIYSLLSSALHGGRSLSTNFGATAAKSTPCYNCLQSQHCKANLLSCSPHGTC